MKEQIEKRLTGLIIVLAMLSVISCSREDPASEMVRLQDNIANSYAGNKRQIKIYEANWVIDRQIVDTTVMAVDSTEVNFFHMPYKYLLEPVLTDEQKALGVKEQSSFPISLTQSGFSLNNTYLEANDNDARTNTAISNIRIGNELYTVSINYDCYSSYSNTNDEWTMTWIIQEVKLTLQSPSTEDSSVSWTYDPAMVLLLITTKQLDLGN